MKTSTTSPTSPTTAHASAKPTARASPTPGKSRSSWYPPVVSRHAMRPGPLAGRVQKRAPPITLRTVGDPGRALAQFRAERDRWDKTQVVATCLYAAATLLIFIGTLLVARSAQQFSASQQTTSLRVTQDQQQEGELQTYLDRMSDLLLSQHLATSQPGDVVREVARARTLTVLRQLDGKRKGLVVDFLQEARLIWTPQVTVGINGMGGTGGYGNPVIDLQGADLRGADLHGIFLRGADLRKAMLAGANLHEADLSAVDLRGADLAGANLTNAVLSAADLRVATLTDAHLTDATLAGANLSLAGLRGADLTGADLTDADLGGATVTVEQVTQTSSLRGAILPDGTPQSRAP